MNFTLLPEGNGTRVNVDTDLTLTGSVAQYGRASGLVKEIANGLIGQFAVNLGKLIADAPATSAQPPQAGPASDPCQHHPRAMLFANRGFGAPVGFPIVVWGNRTNG